MDTQICCTHFWKQKFVSIPTKLHHLFRYKVYHLNERDDKFLIFPAVVASLIAFCISEYL